MVMITLAGLAMLAAPAQSVQLFNTDVLGQPTSQAIKLLVDKGEGDAEPYVVWTDVACGRYIAASAFYRRPVRAADVAAVLEKLYEGSKIVSGNGVSVWRVTDRKFSVQLAEQNEGSDDKVVRVTYIKFAEHEVKQCSDAVHPRH